MPPRHPVIERLNAALAKEQAAAERLEKAKAEVREVLAEAREHHTLREIGEETGLTPDQVFWREGRASRSQRGKAIRRPVVRDDGAPPTGTCTVQEAADRLDTTRQSVYRMISDGRLQVVGWRGRKRVVCDAAGVPVVGARQG